MSKKNSRFGSVLKTSAIVVIFFAMISLIIIKSGALTSGNSNSQGLSGLVSVKGTVKIEALDLSLSEVKKINRAIADHKEIFTQVDLFLDAKGGQAAITNKTVLVMAMVLETNGDCEVRSWSRKISRTDLVPQLILYMNKAAKEYEQFKKYPDVKQNFKCLYI